MNKIIDGTEEFLAMRLCVNCGEETPLYIARVADPKGNYIGTDSRAPKCAHCKAEGWEYNPSIIKYPRGDMKYGKNKEERK